MESIIQSHEIVAHEPVMLNERDADWLATFNILPDTPNQPHFINTLNKLNQQGSIDLRNLPAEASVEHNAIVRARHDFFALMGLSETMAKVARRKPSLLRPEPFIALQRELYLLGLDGPRITKKLPYGVHGVLGRDGTTVKRNFEALQELGLRPIQVIHRFPSILHYSEETIQAKVRCLEELGLKPTQVIHRFPNILGLSEETIQAKVRCLEELGLKPTHIINRFPSIFGLSEETIQAKVAFFQRTVKLLKWEYTAEMLLNTRTELLGFNLGKLQILRRLLARNVISASRNCPPRQIGSASLRPLEAYIIVLAEMNEGEQLSLEELARQANRVKESLAQASRRATVKTITESANKTLGSRVCRMYLEYAKT